MRIQRPETIGQVTTLSKSDNMRSSKAALAVALAGIATAPPAALAVHGVAANGPPDAMPKTTDTDTADTVEVEINAHAAASPGGSLVQTQTGEMGPTYDDPAFEEYDPDDAELSPPYKIPRTPLARGETCATTSAEQLVSPGDYYSDREGASLTDNALGGSADWSEDNDWCPGKKCSTTFEMCQSFCAGKSTVFAFGRYLAAYPKGFSWLENKNFVSARVEAAGADSVDGNFVYLGTVDSYDQCAKRAVKDTDQKGRRYSHLAWHSYAPEFGAWQGTCYGVQQKAATLVMNEDQTGIWSARSVDAHSGVGPNGSQVAAPNSLVLDANSRCSPGTVEIGGKAQRKCSCHCVVGWEGPADGFPAASFRRNVNGKPWVYAGPQGGHGHAGCGSLGTQSHPGFDLYQTPQVYMVGRECSDRGLAAAQERGFSEQNQERGWDKGAAADGEKGIDKLYRTFSECESYCTKENYHFFDWGRPWGSKASKNRCDPAQDKCHCWCEIPKEAGVDTKAETGASMCHPTTHLGYNLYKTPVEGVHNVCAWGFYSTRDVAPTMCATPDPKVWDAEKNSVDVGCRFPDAALCLLQKGGKKRRAQGRGPGNQGGRGSSGQGKLMRDADTDSEDAHGTHESGAGSGQGVDESRSDVGPDAADSASESP